ncbi:ras GTPase-activating protein-binding protein 2-like [Papaver somniferum]|uniref:ras GTPase-activating protein-binding protein 2-like n=1 Tax=Papaver somniferum TaxID=3469 RepID=UPI000E6F91C2|nr:ras GTPase-activating protein-binding protein 2-like [Papaver somniferum]XP_026377484.1 ras GTPase-activating protein-binding protein 2-like [Papaver somniferum]
MATETPVVVVPSAQVVGNAFVEQYYHILHKSPELVFRFYQDASVLSRPGPNGVMSTVSTMNAINQKILSLNSTDYKAEIKTADAQYSHVDGVIVLVTGCLTGKDNVGRKFTQSFFLAPQEKGYYVRNDVFRYLDEDQVLKPETVLVNGTSESITAAPVPQELEPSHVPEPAVPDTTAPIEEELSNGVEVHEHPNNEVEVVVQEEIVEEPPQVQPVQIEARQLAEPVVPVVQEDAPKKSYASIVKVAKANAGPAPVNVPTTTIKLKPATAGQKVPAPAAPTPAHGASAPNSNNASANSNVVEEVEGHSIYIKNLPTTATDEQVEKEFKSFGPIKPGGVQVRSNKGFCFGFVEFEQLSSMQNAVKAGSVTIASRQVYIEEKRTTTRVGGRGRGNFSGRGGFRSDFRGGRGGGNFSGGRGYPRSDFANRGDYLARRGPSGGRGEGYQPVEQNGNGKVAGGRQGGTNQATVAA